MPPQVSAVKVAGRRAYDRARAGEAMDLAPRPLQVARLELVELPDRDTAVFELVCGKGGYVRSLGRDLGRALGCLAHVAALRRLWSGPFHVRDALDGAALATAGPELAARLLPVEAGLAGLPELPVGPEAAARLAKGNPAPVAAPGLGPGDLAWASRDRRPLAIGTVRAGLLHPARVFVLD